jgi:hypothetical protein
VSLPVIQLKCGTSGEAVPTMLLKCGTAGNAVPTLLRACSDDLPDGCYQSPCEDCEGGAAKRTPARWNVLALTIGELGCRNFDAFQNTHLSAVATSGSVLLPTVSPCAWSGGQLCWVTPDYWNEPEDWPGPDFYGCPGTPDGQLSDVYGYITLNRSGAFFDVSIEFPDLPLFGVVEMSTASPNCRSTLSFTGSLWTNSGTAPVGLTLGVRCPL